jgi:hypothetical protein
MNDFVAAHKDRLPEGWADRLSAVGKTGDLRAGNPPHRQLGRHKFVTCTRTAAPIIVARILSTILLESFFANLSAVLIFDPTSFVSAASRFQSREQPSVGHVQ